MDTSINSPFKDIRHRHFASVLLVVLLLLNERHSVSVTFPAAPHQSHMSFMHRSSTTWLLLQADTYPHWGSAISVCIVMDDSQLQKVLLPRAGLTVRRDSHQQASTHVSIWGVTLRGFEPQTFGTEGGGANH